MCKDVVSFPEEYICVHTQHLPLPVSPLPGYLSVCGDYLIRYVFW